MEAWTSSAEKGESVMFHDRHLHRRLGRLLGGAALTVALSMANPAGAHATAGGTPNPAGVWRWIEGLFADPVGWVARPRTPSLRATQAKDLVCPPAGCPTTPTTTSQGPATDPDGRPH